MRFPLWICGLLEILVFNVMISQIAFPRDMVNWTHCFPKNTQICTFHTFCLQNINHKTYLNSFGLIIIYFKTFKFTTKEKSSNSKICERKYFIYGNAISFYVHVLEYFFHFFKFWTLKIHFWLLVFSIKVLLCLKMVFFCYELEMCTWPKSFKAQKRPTWVMTF